MREQESHMVNVELLINKVRENKAIYDASDKNHSNRNFIVYVWRKIGEELSMPGPNTSVHSEGFFDFKLNQNLEGENLCGEKRPFSGPNTSVHSEGFFDFKLNQNVEGENLCDAPCNSVMIANQSFLCDNESVLCDNESVLCDNESVLCDNESVLCDSESVVLCNSESVVLCDNQSVVFSSNSDSVVNDTVDCANDYSVAESDFVCPVCLKTFTNKYNLKRHANKLHSSNIALIESLKTNRSQSFNCEYCHLKFSSQKNIKHHLNKIHTSSNSQTGNYTCPLCYGKFEKQEIIFHFKNAHDIDMNHIELEFNSFNDYLAWKAEIENRTKSKFVSYGSKHINTHGVKCYYFRCHRSGNFVSDSKGLRYLKILGSNKINAYCPAALKVTQHTDGKCVVSYQNVHIGHQNDIGHLFLTAGERKIIASKIAAKIPLDNILDEIRNSISDAGLERVHLLTKKDLHNIEKSFNLSSNAVKHENDGVSVDMWVREMQNSENPYILFYKTQGSSCIQHPFLKENDFVLITMTEAQGEILKKFSSDCFIKNTTISTHDESQLIIDEENQLILNEVTKKKSQTLSLEHRKVELRQKCLKLIDSLNSDKQCDVFDRILKSAPPQLEAVDMLNAQEIHFPTANKDVPPNKNIIPQRFSNAKKKRKLTKTSTVTSQNADNNTILKIILDHKNFTHSPTKENPNTSIEKIHEFTKFLDQQCIYMMVFAVIEFNCSLLKYKAEWPKGFILQ
ncbi:uncharacterized protein TNCT_410441 [Trichonephila clavata]|uniref:C2H2-type domain-containing protein n=1 Tax=Trichonephila clavata TaxID=2740835 RepID=A0A8X6HJT1_TRICU|nr:uncharacterized protein TNCT_410441 [Trichonephila clavata]